ncbi:hypothetical protein TD95_000176 [Thielaviopsis punctulata]|uniref:AB hydrolase-1 domain-containing protein n=1 Tax=Thielaviopsis punctulata TaxID=72032 RepID=A0A0F4ZEL2_9PEZI|nr:hypothetical protein TD95_000176 [Thielaviopsis punctulata]
MHLDSIPAVPPIPKHSRPKSLPRHRRVEPPFASSSASPLSSSSRSHDLGLLAPASHEVLNNLIDSFAVISQPSADSDSGIPPHPTRPSPPVPFSDSSIRPEYRSRRSFGRYPDAERKPSGRYPDSERKASARYSDSEKTSSGRYSDSERIPSSRYSDLDSRKSSGRYPDLERKASSRYSDLERKPSARYSDSEKPTGIHSDLDQKPSVNFGPDSRKTSASFGFETTKSSGSFGVDYGAFHSPPVLIDSLDNLAAVPPIIRTSKPPSGYSSLTASRSLSNRDSSGGLRALFHPCSRPSSRGSLCSREDAQSIGNISIDRPSDISRSHTPELRRSRSTESWRPSNPARNSKGLMYMSSKERLREKEYERKRASVGSSSITASAPIIDHASPHHRPSAPLAEIPITEEQISPVVMETPPRRGSSLSPAASACRIPARDSSLRDSSLRRANLALNESSSRKSSTNTSADRPRHHRRGNSSMDAGLFRRAPTDFYHSPDPNTTVTVASSSSTRVSLNRHKSDGFRPYDAPQTPSDLDEGAPFPAVAQNRRRDHSAERSSKRRSARYSSDALEGLKPKRSSSRLKRLSGSAAPSTATSPRDDKKRASATTASEGAPLSGYERPQSADSIDDAVEAYLRSPRLSQKIRHGPTERVISFSEVGDSEGYAVFCCVGMGLTRYITAFYDELALTLKLRLITVDRPGVGESEAYSDGTTTPLSWPDDVYAICQHLKITKFSILAHSAGAIYALATALRMPQHIRGRIHLLAPWIPPSQMNVFGSSHALPPTNAIPTSQRILRALPTPFLKAANSSFMTATSSSITSSLPKTPRRKQRKTTTATQQQQQQQRSSLATNADKQSMDVSADVGRPTTRSGPESMDRVMPDTKVLTAAFDAVADKERQQLYDERLTHAIWELATTGANPAVDLLVCLERRHTIGFRYVDITRPVVIHHGSRDTRVPVDNVRWLGKTMRRCEVRVLEGESHGLMASATVMGSVLMEIAKEWDDLTRGVVRV